MRTPFTTAEFFDVFRQYNEAVWPVQAGFVAVAVLVSVLVGVRARHAERLMWLVLGALWVWMGAVYHLTFFSVINPAAVLFGGLFIGQGLLFLLSGLSQPAQATQTRTDGITLSGIVFVAYALLIYPLIGYARGHGYPDAPTFGVPCPTTIFTFGILLWAGRAIRLRLIVIPALWSVLAVPAALSFGVIEDLGLLVAGVAGTAMIVVRNRRLRQAIPAWKPVRARHAGQLQGR
jgi:hypothetical protein